MIDKVLCTIKKHNLIEKGEGVVVGVSGGPDSVCLLHILCSLKDQLALKLYAVHINHMLRGKEAEQDEIYVRELCGKLGVPLFTAAFDVKEISKKEGISAEEAGREIRYSQFRHFASKAGATKIAVAHNKNDQAETILMHIMRGTGLDGLKGMEYMRDGIIRPLLDIERKDIEDYCKVHQLNPRQDSSNLESIYTRNKVRIDLIPCINRLFHVDMVESIHKMCLLIKDDVDFIESSAAMHYERCAESDGEGGVRLDLSKLAAFHPAIRKRVVRHAIKEVKGDLKGIESVHIENIISLIKDGRTGSETHLPNGLRAGISYGFLKIHIRCDDKPFAFSEAIKIPGTTWIQPINSSIESFIENKGANIEDYSNIRYNSLVQFFDYEKLKKGINIRNRREGDIFKPYRSNGTKKLKEYFIDNKIPREERDKIPLVALGNEIVWVIGYKISDKFKVTENTKTVLKLIYKKNNRQDGKQEEIYARGH